MKVPPDARRRPARGDDGVTLILFALAMIGILFMVALVIDYGNVRNTRQDSKLLSDSAAAAGLQSLATDATAKPWRGVCTALEYLKANESDLTLTVQYRDGNGNALSGNPCTSLANQLCVANVRTTWAWIHAVAGDRTYDLRSGYRLPDANFPEDAAAYSADSGSSTAGGCDQLAVISSKTDDALFGGIGGVTDYDTAIRSVGRVKIGAEGAGVPAFLMLERRSCDTLSEQVGSGEAGIIVDPANDTDPGIIHVDSSGSPAAGCSGNNGPGGWAVYSSGSSGPKIVANPSSSGTPGIIAINALQVGMPPVAYGGSTLAGLSPAPSPGRVVSRQPIDDKYNPPSAPTISNVHAAAATDANRAVAPPSTYPAARPTGAWATVTACNGGTSTATKVFVNCPGGYTASNPSTFANATDIIFTGPVDIANNRELYMPAARRIVVGGNSNGGLSVTGGGRLGVNHSTGFAANNDSVTGACSGREGPAFPGTTEMTIFGGSSSGNTPGALSVVGRAALCQTFVYLAGPKDAASYSRAAITNGTYDPSCLPAKPCASTTGSAATNAFLYVGGLVQWSAPNQLTVQPLPGAVGVEDLALWTESATLSEVKTGGDLRSAGVFFMPNARLEMRSPASATPRDAQFIARTLQLKQGTLRMKPTPGNAVQVPVLEGIGLVR